jgi:BirA family biotin operon repressor/biotin-[acetyl-CoA-carboxylase] ligase
VTERDATGGVGTRSVNAARPARVAFLSRHERFASVPSTNDIVRSWLIAGTAEVCIAVADEQTSGRGRSGRSWVAPSGAALLLSLGFRPDYLAADRLWRLAAVVSLAMADAAEEAAGLAVGKLRLKWPNDIVVEVPGAVQGSGATSGRATSGRAAIGLRKVAGVLGETEGVGTAGQVAVVGIGINADWPRAEFPAELAGSMTSLREVSGGRPIDAGELLDTFLLHLEPRVLALRDGHFDVAGWHDRQVTTGRMVRLEGAGGGAEYLRAVGVDGATGALLVEDPATPGTEREVLAGEVVQVRLAGAGDADDGDDRGSGSAAGSSGVTS